MHMLVNFDKVCLFINLHHNYILFYGKWHKNVKPHTVSQCYTSKH